MKNIIIMLITFFICIIKPLAYTESYTVMDADSGRILSSKSENNRYLIASTTKVMTALVVIENFDLSKELEVGNEIDDAVGSSIYVEKGEKLKIYDLLYGLLYRSGNDAAMILASNVIPYDNFINLMNEKAIEIGMSNTIFTNPHGLDEKTENYSTSKDLATLMRYASKNKTFMRISRGKKYTAKTSKMRRVWYNKNKLLSMYKYATGGKIGYTKKSKHVFVSSATKGEENLVIASIKDTDRFNTHKNLYEKYFNEYDKYEILNKYTFVIKENYYKDYHLYIKNNYSLLLNEQEKDKIKLDINLTKNKKIKNNDVVGTVDIYIGNEKVHAEKIYAIKEKEKKKKILNWLYFWK